VNTAVLANARQRPPYCHPIGQSRLILSLAISVPLEITGHAQYSTAISTERHVKMTSPSRILSLLSRPMGTRAPAIRRRSAAATLTSTLFTRGCRASMPTPCWRVQRPRATTIWFSRCGIQSWSNCASSSGALVTLRKSSSAAAARCTSRARSCFRNRSSRFFSSPHRLQVATRPWIQVIDAGQPLSMRTALRELNARGIETVSSIGGRTTARAMLREGVVSDLYLTTSPKSAGQPNTPLLEGPLDAPAVVVKEGTGPEKGVRFVHYALL
jgi:hypothetical protein